MNFRSLLLTIFIFIEQLDSSSSLQINLNASFNFSDRGWATLKLLWFIMERVT